MEKELGNIGFVTFLLSGLSYLALGIYLAVNRKGRFESRWLILAIFVSALWSLATAAAFLDIGKIVYFLSFLETLRGVSWAVFFSLLLSRIWTMQGNDGLGRNLLFFLFSFFAIAIILSLVKTVFTFGYPTLLPLVHYSIYSTLVLCIVIFLLVENLYRNSAEDGRWGIKLLVLAVAVLYIYDFLIYADSLLFSAIGGKLFDARGMVNFLIVPVLAVAVSRNPTWKLNIKLSRKVAFHTVTLVGTGAYLIGMSAAGYFLQNFGGRWGNIFQVSFILVALLGLVVLISSGKFRALTQVLLSKHFFQYRYDYREEWLKFINTISATGEHYNLRERVIKTMADVMDSSGGALWLREQPDVFQLAAKWNFGIDVEDELLSGDEFIKFLEQKEWIVDLNSDTDEGNIKSHDIAVPSWLLCNLQYWLVLPLNHLGKLVGFVVLLQPRVKSDLNWESTDLLKTIGRQLASYLAEQIAEKSLAESREFDSFNRKFAFVVHDIKNLASQLSLIVKNAEKHADNPEFQKDVLLTVQDSAKKMNSLLSRITVVQEPSRKKIDKILNISHIMGQMVARYHSRGVNIAFTGPEEVEVYADEESVETIFMHLVENAREACAEGNIKLEIGMTCDGGFAIIQVKDNGHGMTRDFIQNELFRPFRSTKENGYGIGAYESREMIKRLGGRLEVKSKQNVGTTMKVYLRLVDAGREGQAEGGKI
ncbi:MAG: PEP-CTERM system histidine kinase PrsK [Alphaproteobacteria bacterium]|nr:PEP-CTERM system histidine kinase PrsK [Alphaproteobacteria bacterium]